MAKTYKALQGFFCVVLVCVLVFNCFAIPRAKALTATMSLSLAVTALAVLLISSIGVTITAPNGEDVTDYVGSRFQSWVSDKGYSDVGSWFTAQTGISIAGYIASVFSGFLAVGKLAYDALKSFVSYFVSTEGIESGGQPVGDVPVVPSITLPAGGSFSWVDSTHANASFSYNFTSSSYQSQTIGLTGSFSSGTVVSVSQNPPSLPQFALSGMYDSSHYIDTEYYKRPWNRVAGVTSPAINRTSVTLPRDLVYISFYINNWNYSGGSFSGINASGTFSFTVTFSKAAYDEGGAVFAPDTNVLDLPALTDEESYQINSSVITGGMSTTEALAAVGNLAATSEGIKVSAGVRDEPVTPPDTTPIEGLQDVFPFCLPFDFARFLQILSAEREAPHFDWIIPIPAATGLDIEDQYITIDLSDFDDLAATVRNVELIAMCVGLILLTRELLKW